MFRITILCRIAVKLGFLDAQAPARLLAEYRQAIEQTPGLAFIKWAVGRQYLTKEQAQQIKQAYGDTPLECLSCGHRFLASQADLRKPLVCTNCASADLAMRDTPSDKDLIGSTLLEYSGSPQTQASTVVRAYDQTKQQKKPSAAGTKEKAGSAAGGRQTSRAEAELTRRMPFLDSLSEDREKGGSAAEKTSEPGDTSLFEPPRANSEQAGEVPAATRTGVGRAKPNGGSPGAGGKTGAGGEGLGASDTFLPPLPRKPSPTEVRNALPGTYGGSVTRATADTVADSPATYAENTHSKASPQPGDTGKAAALVSSRRETASGGGAVVPPGTVIAGCRIFKKIGQGGMGAVYKAHHLRLDKPVAVKILAPHLVENQTQVKRFIREGRSAAKLEHPNIVGVHDVGQEDRRFYIIMQWVDGESLQDVLDREGILPMDLAVEHITQAARGLYMAHTQSIIHRDIKPDNLMLTNDGRIKVADFGLAKGTKEDLNVSQTGIILGTPYYMSPEQGQNEGVDHRADIYSLGITLYQLLTGKVPFTGTSAVQIIVKHIKEKITPPSLLVPSLPKELEEVVLRMTEKDPTQRFQHMDEVIASLERVAPKLSHDAPDPNAVPSPELFVSTPAQVSEEERTEILGNLIEARQRAEASRSASAVHPVAPPAPVRRGSRAFAVIASVLLLCGGAGAGYYFGVWLPQQDPASGQGGVDTPARNNDGPTAIAPVGSGGAGGERPAETEPNGQGGNGTDDPQIPGDGESPVDRAEITRVAMERFEATREAFLRERTNYVVYGNYENQFRSMLNAYGDLAEPRAAINRQLAEIRELRNNAAAQWLRNNLDRFVQYRDRREYISAQGVLDAFPDHFSTTETASEIAAMRADIAENVRTERDAARLFDRIDSVLNRTPSEAAVAEAHELLEQFDVKEYRDSRFGTEIRGLRNRLQQMRGSLDTHLETSRRERLERIITALQLEVATDLRERNWRVALQRLQSAKSDFEGTELLRQLEALERNVRSEANAAWSRVRERVLRELDAENWQAAFGQLDDFEPSAIDEHREEAERIRVTYIEAYVPRRLQALEQARNGSGGLEAVAELMGVGDFQRVRPTLERYRTRFELLDAGMVPVRIPAAGVAAPDGSGTWRTGEFWIGRHEVTRAQYRAFIVGGGYETERYWSPTGWGLVQDGEFLRQGVHQPAIGWRNGRPEPGTEQWPVTAISYFEAEAYANWAGMRLPSVMEWTIAAGYDPALNEGAGGFRAYPWGERFRTVTRDMPARLSIGSSILNEPAPVGSHPLDVSHWGIFDMGGNAAEWTRDTGSTPRTQVVCGGWFNDFGDRAETIARSTQRQDVDRRDRSPSIGIRLVTRVE